VLADIVEEWEEWQHDRLLQGLQAQNKALARQPRKHKREEPEVDPDAPRQVRRAASLVTDAMLAHCVFWCSTLLGDPPALQSQCRYDSELENRLRVVVGA
jgi:hypothetical protein